MLKGVTHIHFQGVGGIGMSALALLLHHRGYRVSGCDAVDSELIQDLRSRGLEIEIGHATAHLHDVDLLVYTSAVPEDHPERKSARQRNIPEIRRAELLGEVSSEFHYTIAVAGTHGKTTTTGMLGMVLTAAELDPTVFVGGVLPDFGSNLRLGSSDYLAVEADEFDRSFLTLAPAAAIVTAIEADHLDIYENLADIRDTFSQFLSQVSPDGPLILCTDDENLAAFHSQYPEQSHGYGVSVEADYCILDLISEAGKCEFRIRHNAEDLGVFTLNVPGEHNVLNATAVVALMHQLGFGLGPVRDGLAAFRGVERRFQDMGTRQGILFVDDYAHHPTEVAATLEAARSGWPDARIIVVFQPHLYSRTRDFARDFALALQGADLAVLAGIYPAREEPIEGVTSQLIVDEALRAGWQEPHYIEEMEQIPAELSSLMQPGDMLITMGAGDIWKLHDQILDMELVK